MTAHRSQPAPGPGAPPVRAPSRPVPPDPRTPPPGAPLAGPPVSRAAARRPRPPLPARLAARASPLTLAGERRLPLVPALAALLGGGGLRRGTTVVVTAGATREAGAAARGAGAPGGAPPGGAMALALALAAGPSAAGSWVAAVGLPDLGVVAAHEAGVALDRLALVPDPPAPGSLAAVVAALVDGIDVVLVRASGVRRADARRLSARARERGAVIVPVGDGWPEPPALRLAVTGGTWHGLDGGGHGHLRARLAEVEVTGRGGAGRPRAGHLWLPGPTGAATPGSLAGPGAVPPPWPMDVPPVDVPLAAGLPAAGGFDADGVGEARAEAG